MVISLLSDFRPEPLILAPGQVAFFYSKSCIKTSSQLPPFSMKTYVFLLSLVFTVSADTSFETTEPLRSYASSFSYGYVPTTPGPTPEPLDCTLVELNKYIQLYCGEFELSHWSWFGGISREYFPSYKCPHTEESHAFREVFVTEKNDYFQTTGICAEDPGFYQACGQEITFILDYYQQVQNSGDYTENDDGSVWLCGRYICREEDADKPFDYETPCQDAYSEPTLCDDVCEGSDCVDESNCNGFLYGLYCEKNGVVAHTAPWKVCIFLQNS